MTLDCLCKNVEIIINLIDGMMKSKKNEMMILNDD